MRIKQAQEKDREQMQRLAGCVIVHNYTTFLGEEVASQYVNSGESNREVAGEIAHSIVAKEGESLIGFAIIKEELSSVFAKASHNEDVEATQIARPVSNYLRRHFINNG